LVGLDKVLTGMKNAGRAAFRTREYAALLGKKAYAALVLHRLCKKGELSLVRRGWWAFPNAMPEAIASEISKPCYVSFHSAIALHGLTAQAAREVQVAVARNAKKYGVLGTPVREYRVKAGAFNGFSAKEGMLLASPEKAFADCLSVPRACPQAILVEASKGIDLARAKKMLASKAALKRMERVVKIAGQERT